MKKTSTYLSRHTSGIIAALAVLAYAFSASAEEYKSMIRYDRVWEHISYNVSHFDAYYVRFDGAEEINGKTYHRLVAFRHARYYQDYDGQPHLIDIDDSYYKHEGYLREEDGKVYTLVAEGTSDRGTQFKTLYAPNPDFPESYTLEENVLYDFTCKEGESYQGFDATYTVKSIEYVEIDGEEHRLQWVYPYDYEDLIEPFVEGIGVADDGCLTTIILDRPSCPFWSYIFNRVLSTDGRVLYRAELAFEIPVDDFLGTGGTVEITEQTESDAPLYDILGRRIANPAPGQLYIRNGKKHIAK